MPWFQCLVCKEFIEKAQSPFRCPYSPCASRSFVAVQGPPPSPSQQTPPPPPPPPPKKATRVLWRYRPVVRPGGRAIAVRAGGAYGADDLVYLALGETLAAFAPRNAQPVWTYGAGAPVIGSPVLGSDGHVRVHATDGFLHVVDAQGERARAPIQVGRPLSRANPLVDGTGRTWLAREDGGLTFVGTDGSMSARPYYRTRRRFDSTGFIAEGVLYVAGDDHSLRAVAIDEATGRNRWDDSPDKGRTRRAVVAPLARSLDGLILAAGQDDQLYAFRPDGDLAWQTSLPGQVLASPVVTRQGLVVVGVGQSPRGQAPRGLLLAIDLATRGEAWRYPVAGPIESTPVIGDDDTLYFGDNSGCIHAVALDGRPHWQEQLDVAVRSAGTILSPRVVAFGLDDGSLVACECTATAQAERGWPGLLGEHARPPAAAPTKSPTT